jgi:hypothetical protein
MDRVNGRPTCIEIFAAASGGPGVVLATDKGEVKAFKSERVSE